MRARLGPSVHCGAEVRTGWPQHTAGATDVTGVDGIGAWRRLPASVRADVRSRALRGEGHPDLHVAKAAVAWAQRARRVRVALTLAWLMIAPLVGGIAVAAVAFADERQVVSTRVAAFAVFAALALFTPFVLWGLNRVMAPEMESANWTVLVDAAGTAAPPAAPVEIRLRRRPVLLALLALFGVSELAVSVWSFASGEGGATPWLGVAATIMAAGLLGMSLYLQFGPPVAIIGSDEVELVRQGLRIPWSEISDTRPGLLVFARLVRRTCVIWQIPSVEEMSERLGLDRKQRRWLRQNSRSLHPPGIGFPITLIQPGVMQIVPASRAFAARSARAHE